MKIRLVCPCCGRSLRAADSMGVATQVIQRTCPQGSCRNRWQIIIRPLRILQEARIDKLEWTPLGHRREEAR